MANKTTTVNPKWEEIVLVVPRKELFNNEELAFQGNTSDKKVVDKIMQNIASNYKSMRRGDKEDPTPKERNSEINTDFKQPIPYIVIRRGHELFVYERLKGGGEARLHNKWSLGAGGHMNPVEDAKSFNEVLTENLMRELEEELEITAHNGFNVEILGFINDDLDPDGVGQVHIGILGILDLHAIDEVKVRETEQLAGHWIPLSELKLVEKNYNRLENWSKIVVDMLKL